MVSGPVEKMGMWTVRWLSVGCWKGGWEEAWGRDGGWLGTHPIPMMGVMKWFGDHGCVRGAPRGSMRLNGRWRGTGGHVLTQHDIPNTIFW